MPFPPCSSPAAASLYSIDTDALLDRMQQHQEYDHDRRNDYNYTTNWVLGIRESVEHIMEIAEQVIDATDADMLDRIMEDNLMLSSGTTTTTTMSILRSINRINPSMMMAAAGAVEDYNHFEDNSSFSTSSTPSYHAQEEDQQNQHKQRRPTTTPSTNATANARTVSFSTASNDDQLMRHEESNDAADEGEE